MNNYMHQITPEMVSVVDKLKATDFENATKEEIELYSKWVSINEMQKEEFDQHIKARQQEIEIARQQTEQQTKAAVTALEALTKLAEAKLKAVENGKI